MTFVCLYHTRVNTELIQTVINRCIYIALDIRRKELSTRDTVQRTNTCACKFSEEKNGGKHTTQFITAIITKSNLFDNNFNKYENERVHKTIVSNGTSQQFHMACVFVCCIIFVYSLFLHLFSFYFTQYEERKKNKLRQKRNYNRNKCMTNIDRVYAPMEWIEFNQSHTIWKETKDVNAVSLLH